MRALFLVAMGCVAGCGGADGTMGGDGGMVTGDAMVNTGTVTEAEGATRSNDSTSTAESIKLGDTVNGTIGAMVAGMGTDQDFYKFSITAPTLVRITLQTRDSGDYQALGVLVHSTGQTIENIVRPGSGTSMASPRRHRRSRLVAVRVRSASCLIPPARTPTPRSNTAAKF